MKLFLEEKLSSLKIRPEFIQRNINEGFSGGEKKKNELLQLLLLKPHLAVLDEIDSGLDVDALSQIKDHINSLKSESRSFILITHYKNILDYVEPDFVHVIIDGKLVKTRDKSLADEIEKKGVPTFNRVKKMLENCKIRDLFLENIVKLFKSSSKNNLSKVKALAKLSSLGLPKKENIFQYVPLYQLYENSFSLPLQVDVDVDFINQKIKRLVLEEARGSYAVFVDGVLNLDISDFSNIPELDVKNSPFSENEKFKKILKNDLFCEYNFFRALNAALQNSCTYFSIKTALKKEKKNAANYPCNY